MSVLHFLLDILFSRKSIHNSEQICCVTSYPPANNRDAWCAYWIAHNQAWRTEPEIGRKRQHVLTRCRSTVSDIAKGIYPFVGMKLSRADVEWLLITHDNGGGPIIWNDKHQRKGEGLDLRGANLSWVDLHSLPLSCIRGGLSLSEWSSSTVEQRDMASLHLEHANLSLTHLEGAYLSKAHMEDTNLFRAHLEGVDLYRAHLEGAYIAETHLEGASLRNTYLDVTTNFSNVFLEKGKESFALLADVHWGDTNLSLVDWGQIKILGDEYEAKQRQRWDGKTKSKNELLTGYRRAVRANRQLAVVLQTQGLNEEAVRFAYRAQKLQRVVLRMQKRYRQYLFSWFLNLLAGYGYALGRSFMAYLVVIFGFAIVYYMLGQRLDLSLSPLSAFVFSVTSFHGRGFFFSSITPDDPLAVIAAFEAFIGLVIEVTFIAALTQRFFGK